jgi:lysophospholipase L1-like esterase
MSFGFKLSFLLNNHAVRFRLITIGCIVLAFVPFVVPIIFSQPVGQAYLQMIDRQMAKIAPPEFVFVGDSLTANANWRWMLSNNPFTAVNLAESCATINEVSAQLVKARAYHARFVAVLAGTNDVITYHLNFHHIVCNYASLLANIPKGQLTIITLIPYTSFSNDSNQISALNTVIVKLSGQSSSTNLLLDLNPYISTNGVLLPNFTTDGVHFNDRAYQIWRDEILKLIKKLRPTRE